MVSLMLRICLVRLAENFRPEGSGVKTPEQFERLTAGVKPPPSLYSLQVSRLSHAGADDAATWFRKMGLTITDGSECLHTTADRDAPGLTNSCEGNESRGGWACLRRGRAGSRRARSWGRP